MASWPIHVVQRFNRVPVNPRENDFYAPYNKLLYTLFPTGSDFTVAPQFYTLPDSISSVFDYTVLHGDSPVLVLEIKDPVKLGDNLARAEADVQIRRRITDLHTECRLPRLRGISAFGTSLAYYCKEGDVNICPLIQPHKMYESDVVPVERWQCDVLRPDGVELVQKMVEEIKAECAELEN